MQELSRGGPSSLALLLRDSSLIEFILSIYKYTHYFIYLQHYV